MVVFGARALPELLPTTRQWFLSATRRWPARASRKSGCELYRTCRYEPRLSPPETPAPNAGAKRQHQSRSDWSVRLSE